MLRKGSETTAHVAGFGLAIRGLRPSDTSKGFFDSLAADASMATAAFLFDEMISLQPGGHQASSACIFTRKTHAAIAITAIALTHTTAKEIQKASRVRFSCTAARRLLVQ